MNLADCTSFWYFGDCSTFNGFENQDLTMKMPVIDEIDFGTKWDPMKFEENASCYMPAFDPNSFDYSQNRVSIKAETINSKKNTFSCF